ERQAPPRRRNIADIDARVSPKFGRNRILHCLQPLLLCIGSVSLLEQVTAAREVEAEADLVLWEPLWPQASGGRAGDQARNGQQHADRDDDPDQPHLPAREVEHQSFAGLVLGVSTWLIVDLTTRILTPCAISTSASSSLTLVTRPRIPPPVITWSPFLTALIAAWCCFTFCCCGRIIRK